MNGSYDSLPTTANTSYVSSINDAGEAVGGIYDDSIAAYRGVIWIGSAITAFDPPKSVGTTVATTVATTNNAGQTSGYYVDASGHAHGFIATCVKQKGSQQCQP